MTNIDRQGRSVKPELGVKAPVIVASTGNLTLSGAQTIDGVSVSTGRVLVKDQTLPHENGIYDVGATTWPRARDFDGAGEAQWGTLVFISTGVTNGGKLGRLTSTGSTGAGEHAIGSTAETISFGLISPFVLTELLGSTLTIRDTGLIIVASSDSDRGFRFSASEIGSTIQAVVVIPNSTGFEAVGSTLSQTITNKTINSSANTLQLNGNTITSAASVLDLISATAGAVLVRDATAWTFAAPSSAGTVLTSNGTSTAASFQAPGAAAAASVLNIYSSNTTWNKSAGLVFIKATVKGGGGGGGNGAAGNGAGGGGESGMACKTILAASLSTSETVTVGAGGAAGADGDTSSFGALVTSLGGKLGVAAASGGAGGVGGKSTLGQMSAQGLSGSSGSTAGSGAGGGGEGGASVVSSNGNAGTNGCGGGGAHGGGTTGGAGGNGFVAVEEFF